MPVDNVQPWIFAPPPAVGRSLTFRCVPEGEPRAALARLATVFQPGWGVVGVGQPLVRLLGLEIGGLRPFPALAGAGSAAPSTQQALWILLCGADSTVIVDRFELVRAALAPAFAVDDAIDTFTYAGGRDLTGYVDGTENPVEEAAHEAALLRVEERLGGASFVAVQRWVHDLARFRAFPPERRDNTFGRRIEDNEEIDEAPESAHVKRTAQESFDPHAFLVRRSMPWANAHQQGLEFISYTNALDKFERILRRMLGLDDGIVDALFSFSRPQTGGFYWCPPLSDGQLDWKALGIPRK
jgi:putative iron-dependent peroxidase